MKKPKADTPYIDRGEALPQSYAENRIVALVRDPEQIYAYWDVASDVRVAGRELVIRVCNLSEGGDHDLEPVAHTDNWYLRVTPDRSYRLELHERLASGELRFLAASNEVTTPVRWTGQSGERPRAEILHAQRHPLSREKRSVTVYPPAPEGAAPVPAASPAEKVPGHAYVRDTESRG